MFARTAAKCMTKGGIGAYVPTAITTMSFVTQTKMAIANFAEKTEAMENNSNNMTPGGCATVLIAIIIMLLVAIYILSVEPDAFVLTN